MPADQGCWKKWAGSVHLKFPAVCAYCTGGSLTRSPYHTQYDLNLKGCSNPISTLNTDMPDKGQLEEHKLYAAGI